jgi:hypothetical protein
VVSRTREALEDSTLEGGKMEWYDREGDVGDRMSGLMPRGILYCMVMVVNWNGIEDMVSRVEKGFDVALREVSGYTSKYEVDDVRLVRVE